MFALVFLAHFARFAGVTADVWSVSRSVARPAHFGRSRAEVLRVIGLHVYSIMRNVFVRREPAIHALLLNN